MTDNTVKDPKDLDAVFDLAKKRFETCHESDREDREEAITDLEFFNGNQWPESIRSERESEDRPCLVINKLPEKVDQVVGDERQNRPSIKIRPRDGQADPDTAEVLEGLIRQIEYASNAEKTYDYAFEHVSICGRGAWKIETDYMDDDTFDQVIRLRRIENPLAAYLDPGAKEPDGSDAKYGFISDNMTLEDFEANYPDATPVSVDDDVVESDETGGSSLWRNGDQVRVLDYYVKIPQERTIYMLESGEVVEDPPKGAKVLKQRQIDSFQVLWYRLSGREILEGPQEWPGRYIPIVIARGKEVNIDGKRHTRGMVRHARDPQRMLNYWESKATEVVALAPIAPWILSSEQIEGHEDLWDQAHEKTLPYLVYNGEAAGHGLPQRQSPAQIPTGVERRAEVNNEHIKSTTGIYDASLGARSNETSGTAIKARQREGDIATYAYIDNLSDAIRYTGVQIVDLIPKIYDTERVERILGIDGDERQVTIGPLPEGYDPEQLRELPPEERIFDPGLGRYDVVVETGPSYSTQRQESAEAMMELVKANPDLFTLVGDLLVRNMDWPGADDISERLQTLLPPALKMQLVQEGKIEAEKGLAGMEAAMQEGKNEPEGAEPDPTLAVELDQEKMKLRKMMYEAEQAKQDFAKQLAELGMDPRIADQVEAQIEQRLQGTSQTGVPVQ